MKDKGNTLGIFHRAFPVQLPDEPIKFMTAQVKDVIDLDRLRYQKWISKSESSVFTLGELAFGYGTGMEKFADDGFSETRLVLRESPQLAEGLIIEGLVDDAKAKGRHYFGIYRNSCKMIRDDDTTILNGYVIKTGYNLTAVHWSIPSGLEGEESTRFGLIVEPAWTIQREGGREKLSSNLATGRNRDELLAIHCAGGSQEWISSFVDSHREFVLPCGGTAAIDDDPVIVFTDSPD